MFVCVFTDIATAINSYMYLWYRYCWDLGKHLSLSQCHLCAYSPVLILKKEKNAEKEMGGQKDSFQFSLYSIFPGVIASFFGTLRATILARIFSINFFHIFFFHFRTVTMKCEIPARKKNDR